MKNVLVVGGAGYIGSHVVQSLQKAGNQVFVLDDLSTGHQNSVAEVSAFYEVSILNSDKVRLVFEKTEFDAIFHFAAKLSVPESIQKPYDYFETNSLGTANLLKLCLKFGVKKFVYASTSAVYGEPANATITESDSCVPINPYGLSKKFGEELILQHARLVPDFRYKILRYFNVAGATPDLSNGPRNLFTGQLILNLCRAALGDKKVKVFGNQYATPDGTCVRDYIHVYDLAAAHVAAYQNISQSSVWNCGYGRGYSVLEVIRAFEESNKIKFKLDVLPPRAGDPASLISDTKKILAESDWKPKFDSLEAICKSTFDWVNK